MKLNEMKRMIEQDMKFGYLFGQFNVWVINLYKGKHGNFLVMIDASGDSRINSIKNFWKSFRRYLLPKQSMKSLALDLTGEKLR